MKVGVPMIADVLVFTLLSPSPVSLAMPKSRILARSPPATSTSRTRKMFSGLRSRWTMPRACADCSDDATCRRIRTASNGGSRPKRRSRPSRVSPSRYSITMNALPSVW